MYIQGKSCSIIALGNTLYKCPKWFVKTNNQPTLPAKIFTHFIKNQTSEDKNILHAAFHPGFACNLSCPYCYQITNFSRSDFIKPHIPHITETNLIKIVDFIHRRAQELHCQAVDIALLGGEPFLYLDDIEKFIDRTKQEISISNISFITNGSLLTDRNIQRIKNFDTTYMQLTFDGDEATHNKYRHTKTHGTYNEIMNSVPKLLANNIKVCTRINITKENINTIQSLLLDLQKFSTNPLFHISFALIDDTKFYHSTIKIDDPLYQKYITLYPYAIKLNLKITLPSPRYNCVTCGNPNDPKGIVVASNGLLYSCWDAAGQPNMYVGNVVSGYDKHLTQTRWVHCGYESQKPNNYYSQIYKDVIHTIADEC